MFEFLRKMIGPIMLLVLVAFIATIIFSWGGGGFREKPRDVVGVIDGENINIKTYEQYYSNMLRKAQQENDYELPAGKIEEIRNQAWQQLLSDYLINKEIKNHNIAVTPDEIYSFLKLYPPQEIQSAPQFMTDGAFDYQKYVNAMVNPENAPFWANLESYVLPDLKKYKLQEQIISTVRVTPAEVMESFLDENEKVKIGYINIKNSLFNNMVSEPTEEEVKEYYDSHLEDFATDERASIEYVNFDIAPSENDWQKVRYEIQDIYDSVLAGSDFAEFARIFSEDNSAESGGDLGWFEQGRMVPEFDSAVFAMKVDEISPPIRTQFGYHIIKLLGIKGNERNAAHILLKVEPSQDTRDQTLANANDFVQMAKKDGFDKTAEEYNYEIKKSSQPFDKNSFISAELRQDKDIIDFAFSNKVGAISDPFELQNFYTVVKLTERIPAGYFTLDESIQKIKSLEKRERSKQIAMDTANVIYNAIKGGSSFSRAATTYGFQYATSDLLTRNSVVPNVGRSDEVIGASFALKAPEELAVPVQYNSGVVVMKLLEKISADLEVYNQKQDSLRVVALQKKQQAVYSRWYRDLVANANVENYLSDFYKNY